MEGVSTLKTTSDKGFHLVLTINNWFLKLKSYKYMNAYHSLPTNTTESVKPATWKDCYETLSNILGPVVYQNRKITEPTPNDLLLANETPCIIEIRNSKEKIMGSGCFYGNGHVLTALHVLKDQYDSEIHVIFHISEGFLVYKAEFTKHCNTYPDRDQAFLKLLGNTSPLGDGLQNQIGKVNENDNMYFHTLTDSGHFQKQECKVIRPNPHMKSQMFSSEFIVSAAGRPGDSGSPVFCNGKWVGIYRGIFFNDIHRLKFGRCSEIDPKINPWASSVISDSHFPIACPLNVEEGASLL